MEEGMTMTANTPASISARQGAVNESHHAPEVHESTIQDSIEVTGNVDEAHEDAGKLLEVVKENGFEHAFEFLADDTEQEIEDSINEPEEQQEDEVAQDEKDMDVELQDIQEEERNTVFERIKELEEKVTNLEEKNKELSDRLKNSEENLRLSLETMQQMALILKELVEEEEDEQKKLSLLQILITLMGNLMQELAYPEDEASQERPQQVAPNRQRNTSKKVIPYSELLKRMRERKSGQPVVEKAPVAA